MTDLSKILRWVWQPNNIIILGKDTKNPPSLWLLAPLVLFIQVISNQLVSRVSARPGLELNKGDDWKDADTYDNDERNYDNF